MRRQHFLWTYLVLLLIAFLVGVFKKKRTPVAAKEVKEDETSIASPEALEATKEQQIDELSEIM